MKPLSTCAILFAFVLACHAQEQPPPKPAVEPPPPNPAAAAQQPDPAKLLAEVMQQFAAEHIDIDRKAQTVTIDAVMNNPPDPLEYLLIHRKGKMHEAMFFTESKPSVLNAALLMAGFEPGKNASYEEKQPPPTLEQIEQGADPVIVHPPSGMQVWMTVHWKDAAGKQHDRCIDDLLMNLRTQKRVRDSKWYFLGGRMAPIYKGDPPVFVADYEGNLVSTCYMLPDNHLVTIAHADARNQDCWWLTDLCPEPGTEVKFVFHRQQPKIYQEREARLAKEPPDPVLVAPPPEPEPEPEAGKGEPGKGEGGKGEPGKGEPGKGEGGKQQGGGEPKGG